MNKNIYCVIMAGGVGSRFWPISRAVKPKQFLDFFGTGRSLLQQTYDRISQFCNKENVIVVTFESYKDLVKEQLPELKDSQILCEPLRKNTAPCIAYASFKIFKANSQAVMVVTPADHLILNNKEFETSILLAATNAQEKDSLVTIGIEPTRPDTGYGYIQYLKENNQNVHKVKTFTEKPNLELAQTFLKSGEFLWNAGIFVWTVKTILNAFQEYLPDMFEAFDNIKHDLDTPQEATAINGVYQVVKNISIDYGILEKAKNCQVVKSNFGWSDVGTWGALYTLLDKDENANYLSNKNIMTYDCKGSIVQSENPNKLIILQGLQDYIIVETNDVLMICKKEEEQQIRYFVNDVKVNKGDKFI